MATFVLVHGSWAGAPCRDSILRAGPFVEGRANAYHVGAGNAGRFLARPGDVPVHRLKAWLNAPISE